MRVVPRRRSRQRLGGEHPPQDHQEPELARAISSTRCPGPTAIVSAIHPLYRVQCNALCKFFRSQGYESSKVEYFGGVFVRLASCSTAHRNELICQGGEAVVVLMAPPGPPDRVLSRQPSYQRATLAVLVLGLCLAATACASQASLADRTFFRPEYEVDTHGRKTWFDRLVETDPGGFKTHVAAEYESVAPARIAVLPFEDTGSAQFVVDKIALTARSPEQQADWAWTHSNRLRRAVDGYLSSREFLVANLIQVDQIMKEHRIYNAASLARISPQTLGGMLGVDAVVYGEVTHYEAYYLALVSAYEVGVKIRMVSTHDGRELFAAEGSRYDVDVAPAFDPVDIAINSAFTLLQLRDIVLARAEDESAREIILRIPRSQRLQDELIEEATDAPSRTRQENVATLQREGAPQAPSGVEPASMSLPTE
jgi:hypothetical protein